MKISVGHNEYVESDSIVAVLHVDSAPARNLRYGASENGMLINATKGRKARSLIVLENNQILLSALRPKTLKSRIQETSSLYQ